MTPPPAMNQAPAAAAAISGPPPDAAPRNATEPEVRRSWVDRGLEYGLYAALAALLIGFSFSSPYFLVTRNLLNIGQTVAVTGILAVGMTVALIAGKLDLSVGSVLGLSSVVTALAIESAHLPTAVGVLLGLLSGLLVGALNAALVVGVGINAIIVTLATGIAVQGVALISTSGQLEPVNNLALQDTIALRPLGVPLPFLVMLVLFLIGWVLLTWTRVGWHVYATGGGEHAALRSGVKVKRLFTGVFLATGLLAALTGVITAGQAGSGGPNYGTDIAFDVLTAVLLGGIGLGGGSGTVQRTLAGVLLIGVLNNGLTLLNVDTYYQQTVRGAVFVLAVVLGAVAERRNKR